MTLIWKGISDNYLKKLSKPFAWTEWTKPEKEPHGKNQSVPPDLEPEVVNTVGVPWRRMTHVSHYAAISNI